MDLDGVTGLGLGAVALLDVLELKLIGGIALGDLDNGLFFGCHRRQR
jgi:hypothetical protein